MTLFGVAGLFIGIIIVIFIFLKRSSNLKKETEELERRIKEPNGKKEYFKQGESKTSEQGRIERERESPVKKPTKSSNRKKSPRRQRVVQASSSSISGGDSGDKSDSSGAIELPRPTDLPTKSISE